MKTTWLALSALAVVVSAGCDSEVTGGGGGAGGEGGAGTSVVASSGETTSTSVATGTSSADSTATGTSSGSSGGGGNGGNGGSGGSGGAGLGTCEEEGGTAVSSGPGGGSICEASYACEGGDASVECIDNVCECYLDGTLEGTCEGDSNACWFPLGCCFELLGGVARPNPGPFGACEGSSGTATSGQGGGVSMCDNFYSCEGGELTVSCEETEAGGATCTCKEGQGFTLGTCEQETLSCEYESSCCYAIFNP